MIKIWFQLLTSLLKVINIQKSKAFKFDLTYFYDSRYFDNLMLRMTPCVESDIISFYK